MNSSSDHFRPNGDDYLVSPAGVLAIMATAVSDPTCSRTGRARAQWVVNEVIREAKHTRYPGLDVLETVLKMPADRNRLMEQCDSFVKHIGNDRYVAILVRSGIKLVGGGSL